MACNVMPSWRISAMRSLSGGTSETEGRLIGVPLARAAARPLRVAFAEAVAFPAADRDDHVGRFASGGVGGVDVFLQRHKPAAAATDRSEDLPQLGHGQAELRQGIDDHTRRLTGLHAPQRPRQPGPTGGAAAFGLDVADDLQQLPAPLVAGGRDRLDLGLQPRLVHLHPPGGAHIANRANRLSPPTVRLRRRLRGCPRGGLDRRRGGVVFGHPHQRTHGGVAIGLRCGRACGRGRPGP